MGIRFILMVNKHGQKPALLIIMDILLSKNVELLRVKLFRNASFVIIGSFCQALVMKTNWEFWKSFAFWWKPWTVILGMCVS